MKKLLLTLVLMAVLFMSGCGEENPNALPDNGAGAMMPDNGTTDSMMPDSGAESIIPNNGTGTMTPDNSGIMDNVK